MNVEVSVLTFEPRRCKNPKCRRKLGAKHAGESGYCIHCFPRLGRSRKDG